MHELLPSASHHYLQIRIRRNLQWTLRRPTRHPTHRPPLLRADTRTHNCILVQTLSQAVKRVNVALLQEIK